MKLSTAISFFVLAILLSNGASSRLGHHPAGKGRHSPGRGHHHRNSSALFIFGDSFADTGNLPRSDDRWPVLSRQWRYPYGGNGRFSNGVVEADLIAKMLGHSEAPPPHALGVHPGKSGMNFAVGGSGVFEVPEEKATLAMQVDSFYSLLKVGSIARPRHTVALVALSAGNDYDRVGASSIGEVTTLVEKVTDEVVANVARLQRIGVQKLLINNMYPLGCAPSLSRATNYTSCDELANKAASLHNRRLADKLAGMDNVIIVDLSGAFNSILKHHADGGGEVAQHFLHKLVPCCESLNAGGYCGQREEKPHQKFVDMYTVCDNADDYFFWDDVHPTQAGWTAVMTHLESRIVDFIKQ